MYSQCQITLQWRHNGRKSVSNHQPHDCLHQGLFKRRSKKTWKLRVTGLCAGNSPGTGEIPARIASNAENGSIWWRHHVMDIYGYFGVTFYGVFRCLSTQGNITASFINLLFWKICSCVENNVIFVLSYWTIIWHFNVSIIIIDI